MAFSNGTDPETITTLVLGISSLLTAVALFIRKHSKEKGGVGLFYGLNSEEFKKVKEEAKSFGIPLRKGLKDERAPKT